ncbi:hypothetical protein HP456_11515 [Bacillus haikouensis]|uniref:hypothetical protein n=1 Tax=Bacillus haikouensis TaxID=1510468 RepID=UPI0015570CFF|nr:hypothetical protein [Bacillus haikouensis]NQD66546.1 hypothetical protein [Bacillus haikouensis]
MYQVYSSGYRPGTNGLRAYPAHLAGGTGFNRYAEYLVIDAEPGSPPSLPGPDQGFP